MENSIEKQKQFISGAVAVITDLQGEVLITREQLSMLQDIHASLETAYPVCLSSSKIVRVLTPEEKNSLFNQL